MASSHAQLLLQQTQSALLPTAHSRLEPLDILEEILGVAGLRHAGWGPVTTPGARVLAAPGNHEAGGGGEP